MTHTDTTPDNHRITHINPPQNKRMHVLIPLRANATSVHAHLQPIAPLSLSRLPSLSMSGLPLNPPTSCVVLPGPPPSLPPLRHLPPSRSYIISRVDVRLCRKQHLRHRNVAVQGSHMQRRLPNLPGTRAAGRGEREALAHARQRRLHRRWRGQASGWAGGCCCCRSQRW